MKDEYKDRNKYRKFCNLLEKRFRKISNNGNISKAKFYRLVFLDMILDWIERDKNG